MPEKTEKAETLMGWISKLKAVEKKLPQRGDSRTGYLTADAGRELRSIGRGLEAWLKGDEASKLGQGTTRILQQHVKKFLEMYGENFPYGRCSGYLRAATSEAFLMLRQQLKLVKDSGNQAKLSTPTIHISPYSIFHPRQVNQRALFAVLINTQPLEQKKEAIERCLKEGASLGVWGSVGLLPLSLAVTDKALLEFLLKKGGCAYINHLNRDGSTVLERAQALGVGESIIELLKGKGARLPASEEDEQEESDRESLSKRTEEKSTQFPEAEVGLESIGPEEPSKARKSVCDKGIQTTSKAQQDEEEAKGSQTTSPRVLG